MRHFWLWTVLIWGLVGCRSGVSTEIDQAVTPSSVFSEFYIANGATRTFGNPITQPYTDPTGHTVQYFQNMRLEFDPTTGQIIITPLGEWALQQSGILYPDSQPPKDAFLEFYKRYHGELLFGDPLTPEIREGEYIVQYFQNVRLEWHPENPPALRVQLGWLGDAHFRLSEAMTFYQQQHPGSLIPASDLGIQQVNLAATVKSAILFTGENQTLFVRVQTPEGSPFVNSSTKTEATLTYPDGATQTVLFPPTNAQGQTEATFALSQPSAGDEIRVVVTMQDSSGKRLGETILSFQTWWYK